MPTLVAACWRRVKPHAVAAAFGMVLVTSPVAAQGDARSCAADTDPFALKPGQFVWTPEIAPEGPLVIVVNLSQQRAHVYRNGVRIGVSSVSTGRQGYETPTGMFPILDKRAEHYSNIYDNAPMPFMLRLTWDGIAIHAGRDPGEPASHGCIRLPLAFAKSLFDAVPIGSQVIVTDSAEAPGLVASPAMFTAKPARSMRSASGDHWSPERAQAGLMTIVVSGADKAVSVQRAGVEIGRSRITIAGRGPLHTHALVLMSPGDGSSGGDERGLRSGDWLLVDLAADAYQPPERRHADDVDRIRMPRDFAAKLLAALLPGTTMLISDRPLEDGRAGTLLVEERR